MLKKRLIGAIIVKDGWAVQSFGYKKYLPLGRPETIAENLDRWGADEILILSIDRTIFGLGPDLDLLRRVAELGLSTPLIYGGGIRGVQDAVKIIQGGADRISLDAALHGDPGVVRSICEVIGAQAAIAALPLSRQGSEIVWYDYRQGRVAALESIYHLFEAATISEALVIDYNHEGYPGAFDAALAEQFPVKGVPVIAFGGISTRLQVENLLALPGVTAVAVGNSLNYAEHSLQSLRSPALNTLLRPAVYQKSAESPV